MPQKIDILADVLEKKDYERLERSLILFNQFKESCHTQNISSTYQLNLEKLSSKRENLLCKAVIAQDFKASLLLLQYGANIKGTQAFTYTINQGNRIESSRGGKSYYSITAITQEKQLSVLDYALRYADLALVKLLLMNEDSLSIAELEASMSLKNWDNDSETNIKWRADYTKLTQILECFKFLKQGFSVYQSSEGRHQQDAQALIFFMQALSKDVEFTLECFEAFIKEVNSLSQGLLPESRFTHLDTSADLGSLRTLLHAISCFFNVATQHHTLSPAIFTQFEQTLIDVVALQQNLLSQDTLKQKAPFPTTEAARAFILLHVKSDIKTTIERMNHTGDAKAQDENATVSLLTSGSFFKPLAPPSPSTKELPLHAAAVPPN